MARHANGDQRQLADRGQPRYRSCQSPVRRRGTLADRSASIDWPDGAHYDATVRRLIHHGAALDEGSIYFLARLSPHYPTVEVRVADVCPDVDTALLVAALVRALVETALADV